MNSLILFSFNVPKCFFLDNDLITAQWGITADKRELKDLLQIAQWATSFSRGMFDHILPGWAMSMKTLLNI